MNAKLGTSQTSPAETASGQMVTPLSTNAQYKIYNGILNPWFENGGKISALKVSASKALLHFVADSGFTEEVFEKRAMLGRYGTLTLEQIRKNPDKLDTDTITCILAATRKTTIQMFHEQLAGPDNQNRVTAALTELMNGIEKSLGLTTDTASFEKSFKERPDIQKVQDLATAFLRN